MPAGFRPLHNDLDTWVRDPFTFLMNRPAMIVGQSASQSIPSSTITTLQLNTVGEDPYGGWVTTGSAPNYRWVCPASGWYWVTLNVWLSAGTGNQLLDAILNINGTISELNTPWLVTFDAAGGVCGGQLAYLTTGQYLQAQVFHSNATALNTSVTFGQSSTFTATWRSN
jgi:hypothetical protein